MAFYLFDFKALTNLLFFFQSNFLVFLVSLVCKSPSKWWEVSLRPKKSVFYFVKKEKKEKNTPVTMGGPGCRDQMPALNNRKKR